MPNSIENPQSSWSRSKLLVFDPSLWWIHMGSKHCHLPQRHLTLFCGRVFARETRRHFAAPRTSRSLPGWISWCFVATMYAYKFSAIHTPTWNTKNIPWKKMSINMPCNWIIQKDVGKCREKLLLFEPVALPVGMPLPWFPFLACDVGGEMWIP